MEVSRRLESGVLVHFGGEGGEGWSATCCARRRVANWRSGRAGTGDDRTSGASDAG